MLQIVNIAIISSLTALIDGVLAHRFRSLPLYRRHFYLSVALILVPMGALPFGLGTQVIGVLMGLTLPALLRMRTRSWLAHSWMKGSFKRKDPNRPLIVIADPHWSQDTGHLKEIQKKYVQVDWLFLGDCFDLWIGLPNYETSAQKEFLDWVDQRRQEGAWVGLWLGNREYFLDYLAPRFDLMGEGTGGYLAGESLYFEHGDLINKGDVQYRLWNLLSRSSLAWIMFRLIPSSWGQRLGSWLESKLRTTNQNYKITFPQDSFSEVAQSFSPSTFIVGHFHTEHQVENGRVIPWNYSGVHALWSKGHLEVKSIS